VDSAVDVAFSAAGASLEEAAIVVATEAVEGGSRPIRNWTRGGDLIRGIVFGMA